MTGANIQKRVKGRKGERAKGRKGERAKGRKDERAKGRKDERAKGRKGERTKGRKDERVKGKFVIFAALFKKNENSEEDIDIFRSVGDVRVYDTRHCAALPSCQRAGDVLLPQLLLRARP